MWNPKSESPLNNSIYIYIYILEWKYEIGLHDEKLPNQSRQ